MGLGRDKPADALDRRQFGRTVMTSGTALALLLATSKARAGAGVMYSPDIQSIKDRGRLIVGMTGFDSAPFYYFPRRNGNDGARAIEGLDVKLAKDLAQVLDVELVIDRQATSFNAVIDDVAAGKTDIGISKLSVTPRRAVSISFTQPVIELRHALLVNRLSLARRAGAEDLRSVINRNFDGIIGVIARSSYADMARQVFSKADIREFAVWDEVVEAVASGSIDFAYRDELEVKKLMRLKPELHLNLRSVLITDIRDAIAAALPYNSYHLLDLADIVIAQTRKVDANQLLDNFNDIFAETLG